MKRFCLFVVLGGLLKLGAAGCGPPNVQRFERFELSPGHVDVLWLFIDERLHRCVATPRGPVCSRANYVKSDADEKDVASIPPTPQVAAGPPVPQG